MGEEKVGREVIIKGQKFVKEDQNQLIWKWKKMGLERSERWMSIWKRLVK